MTVARKRVEGVVLVEMDIPAAEDPRDGFMRRLDAFRESVLPEQEHGLHIHTWHDADNLPVVDVLGPQGRGPSRVLLGERERKALSAVLDYCIPDEAQDFREQFETEPDPAREAEHVLSHLVTLSNALLGEDATARGMAGLEDGLPGMERVAQVGMRASIPER